MRRSSCHHRNSPEVLGSGRRGTGRAGQKLSFLALRESRISHLGDDPPGPSYRGVVIDVEEAQLLVLLPQNHEDGVEELEVLVVVVQPDEESKAKVAPDGLRSVAPPVKLVRVAVSHHLANEAVAAPRVVQHLRGRKAKMREVEGELHSSVSTTALLGSSRHRIWRPTPWYAHTWYAL